MDQKKSMHGGILAFAGIIVRVIGLIYRIPMLNIIGDKAYGIYSTAFNVYNFMLVLSSYGLPMAISKLVSDRLAQKHYKDAKKIFFENVGNRDTLVEDGIIRKEQTVVMPGAGVNLEEFHYYPYPDDKDGVTFLFVGRIMQEKGVDELFEAIEYICQKYPKTVFDFIGWYEDDYKERFEALQNKGYTRFDGWQSDVRPFYEKCHCIIHPSWHEGMSNTLLEGAACGRPLITNRIHGCMEAVDEGVNGLLCEKKSAASIKENLERFLQMTNEQRRKMGVAGREKMQREFNKFDVVEKTIGQIFED